MRAEHAIRYIDPDDWVLHAACKSQRHLFFPPDFLEAKTDRRQRESAAKAICSRCPVRDHCLDQALRNGEKFGIWGGMTERERRALLKKNKGAIGSPQDIAGLGRRSRLPAVVVRDRPMSS